MTVQLASILAIDTSSSHCSVALQTDAGVFHEHILAEQSHSEQILPMVRRLLNDAGTELAKLDALAVGVGPGGFTGVRLGVAVTQGLAYAMDKPVVALSSLLALAYAAWDHRGSDVSKMTVVVANDARMGQVYWAVYRFEVNDMTNFSYHELAAPSLCDAAELPNLLLVLGVLTDEQPCLVGNAFSAFKDLADWASVTGIAVANVDHGAPNALYLLPLAQLSFLQQQFLPPHQVAPLYVRDKIALTIAEREALKNV